MKVVVVKSPKVISGLMRLIFKIKKEKNRITGGTRLSAVNFFAIAEKLLDHRNDLRAFILVPLTGLEPVRVLPRGILSPLCLPIPPQRHTRYIITLFCKCQRFFAN